jgi:hypothetical protein
MDGILSSGQKGLDAGRIESARIEQGKKKIRFPVVRFYGHAKRGDAPGGLIGADDREK